MESTRKEITTSKRVLEAAASYINAAKTPEERNNRKAYMHALTYNCKQTFAEFVKCRLLVRK